MATKKPLRAVGPDEKPAPKKPATIKAAVDMSERDLLVAMRAKVAAEIDAGPPAHALPRLIQQLRELDKDIRAIDARTAEESDEGVPHDDREVDDAPFDASSI